MFRFFAALFGLTLVLTALPAVGAFAQADARTEIAGTSGEPVLAVTIDEVVDPFELYDPSVPPVRGYRYVMVTMTVANLGSSPYQFDPGNLLFRDTEGFLYGDELVYPLEETAGEALAYQEIPDGAEVSGWIAFQVLNGVTLADLYYIPADGQIVRLNGAGEGAAGTEVGDATTIIANDGSEIGSAIINELADPYEDFPGDQPPDRGHRYVLVSVTMANAGPRPILVDPGNFLLQDSDGFLYGSIHLIQEEDAEPALEYGELAAGDEVSGTIVFSVVDDVDLARLFYQPAGDRLIVLVDVTGRTAGGEAVTRGDDEPTPEGDDDSVPGDTGEVDCDEINDWLVGVYADASVVEGLVATVYVMRAEEDPEFVEIAGDVAKAFAISANGLRTSDPPQSVAELNEDLADAYEAFGEALQAVADATESGDEAELEEAGQALYDAEPGLIEAIRFVEALANECGVEAS